MAVNLTGTFNLTRIACKYLVNVPPEGPDGERGVVIMVASAAAVRSSLCSMLRAYRPSHLSLKASLVRQRILLQKARSSV